MKNITKTLKQYIVDLKKEQNRVTTLHGKYFKDWYANIGRTIGNPFCEQFYRKKITINNKQYNTCVNCPLNPSLDIVSLTYTDKVIEQSIGSEMACFNHYYNENSPEISYQKYIKFCDNQISKIETLYTLVYFLVYNLKQSMHNKIKKIVLNKYAGKFQDFKPFQLLAMDTLNIYIYLTHLTQEEIDTVGEDYILSLRVLLIESYSKLEWYFEYLTQNKIIDIKINYGEPL